VAYQTYQCSVHKHCDYDNGKLREVATEEHHELGKYFVAKTLPFYVGEGEELLKISYCRVVTIVSVGSGLWETC
jgi:hypothetical protein